MTRRIFALALAALMCLTGTCALAEQQAFYEWEGDFPDTPQMEHHAYIAVAAEPDGDAFAEAIWPGLEWSKSEDEEDTNYILEADDNDLRGEREIIRVMPGLLIYSRVSTESNDGKTIGGPEVAYQQVYEFARTLFPEETFAHPLPMYQYIDENGERMDNFYEVVWRQEVEPGVYSEQVLLAATIYPEHYINYMWYRPYEFQPVEDAPAQQYISSEQALYSLNYVAAHIDPEHTCTTFDDPDDSVMLIYPALTDKFSDSGESTLCWAFVIEDALKGFTRTVLVDAVSGDVYDDHDGRLAGSIS